MNLPARLALFTICISASALGAGDDSKPQLVSRTGGGGNSWSNPQELQKDAEQGKPAALAAFGEMLLTGEQTTKDVPRALAMLERAAKAGQTSAAFRLGKVYDDGELAARDAAKALEYYKQAALAGVVEAQYNIGALYMSGRGIKRDYKEGLAWLIVARKNGAEPAAEVQVRQRFQSTHREKIIADAEARATELQEQIAKPGAGTSPKLDTGAPQATPPAGSK